MSKIKMNKADLDLQIWNCEKMIECLELALTQPGDKIKHPRLYCYVSRKDIEEDIRHWKRRKEEYLNNYEYN